MDQPTLFTQEGSMIDDDLRRSFEPIVGAIIKAQNSGPVTFRLGGVVSFTVGNPTTCTVDFGDGVATGAVRCLDGLRPSVGGGVWVADMGNGKLLAVGTIGVAGAGTPSTYTPAMTVWSLGNGTASGQYFRMGPICYFNAVFTFGSTSTFVGEPTFSLPVTPSAFTNESLIRSTIIFSLTDNSGAGAIPGVAYSLSGSTIKVLATDKSSATYATVFGNPISGTYPYTWTTSDAVRYAGWYFI